MDEIPEFGVKNLETLRQPLEDKVVTISRASGTLIFPANFMFIAALNPLSLRLLRGRPQGVHV